MNYNILALDELQEKLAVMQKDIVPLKEVDEELNEKFKQQSTG